MAYCFDIGGTNIRFGMPTSTKEVPVLASVPTPKGSLDEFCAAIIDLIARYGEGKHNVVAISIAGIVDPRNNRVKVANIPAIDSVDLASVLTAKTGLQTLIANDADCLALAEATIGVAAGAKNVFGLILGTGVGGGIVINGQIVVGAHGATGEIGHGTVVDPTAGGSIPSIGHYKCGCGQIGCLDTIGGARGLERIHLSLHEKTLTSIDVVNAWVQRQEEALRTVEVWSDMLAGPLSMVINLLGPEIVPVGGGLSGNTKLIAMLDKKVRARTLIRRETPILVPAKFSANGGLVGAAQLQTNALRGAA